jgi:hypothetical protein
MTDLDTLRRALQAPPATDLGGLPIGQVMVRGRRLRRRRRILAAAGTAALAAVLVTVVASTGQFGKASRPRHLVPPLSPGHSVPQGHNAPYGSVIATGIRDSAGELVFYAVRIHLAQLPKTTFGVMAGYRGPGGKLTGAVESNEFSGPDTAPGFHAVEAPMSANGRAVPEFGYYAGPAAKITGTVDGRSVQADQARWSENPKIVIFWFPARGNPAAHPVTGMAAYNAKGKLLPSGHASPGVG